MGSNPAAPTNSPAADPVDQLRRLSAAVRTVRPHAHQTDQPASNGDPAQSLHDRPPGPLRDDDLDEPRSVLETATPWLALLAVVLSAGALGYVVFGRSGADLTACRTAAWSAIPSRDDLPRDWNLGSTDLNANGMTISILGPAPADGSTSQAVVYASITCYGDVAATALDENRKAAEAAGSTVTPRTASGQAYDVDNPLDGLGHDAVPGRWAGRSGRRQRDREPVGAGRDHRRRCRGDGRREGGGQRGRGRDRRSIRERRPDRLR